MDDHIITINRNESDKLYKLQKSSIKVGKKSKDYFDKKEFNKYSELKERLKRSDNPDIIWFDKQFHNPKFQNVTIENFLVKYNNLTNGSWLEIKDNNKDFSNSTFHKYDNSNNKFKTNGSNKQYNISSFMYRNFWEILEPMNYIDREIYEKQLILNKLIFAYDNLQNNGNLLITFFNWSQNQTIDMLYLILLLFKKVTIYFGSFIFCSNFSPIIRKDYLKKLYDINFVISDKPRLNELSKYLINSFKNKNQELDLFLKNKFDKIIIDRFNLSILMYRKLQLDENKIHKIYFETFKRLINKNELIKVGSAINKQEGEYITSIIKKHHLKKCLEVGFANGISALYILSASKKTTLTSLDPFQKTQWNNNGVKLLTNSKLIKRHKLIEKKSYIAMPELLEDNEEKFDFIFIDGWHTFDYTLLDFFYADKLLRTGGIIIIDDAKHLGVAKCIKYIDSNYKDFYKRIESHNTIASYKKIKNDTRDWNYHKFF